MSFRKVEFGEFQGEILPEQTSQINDGQYDAIYWSSLPKRVANFVTSDLDNGIVRSWKPNCPVEKEGLSYLQFTHLGFGEQQKVGEMIVNQSIVEEVANIFSEIYQEGFPIEKARLIDYYYEAGENPDDAADEASMADNNSSSFCSRQITGGGRVSWHSYGLAIDINPFLNPYCKKRESGEIFVAPKASATFLKREEYDTGLIKTNGITTKAFANRGWDWGGNWTNPTDYQHFQKGLT